MPTRIGMKCFAVCLDNFIAWYGPTPDANRYRKNIVREIAYKVLRKRQEILFMLLTVASPAVSMSGIVVCLKFLTPDQMGTLTTISLIPIYMAGLHLGVFNGLARELPMEIGAGRNDEARRLENSSSSFALSLAVILAGIMVLAGLLSMLLSATRATTFLLLCTSLAAAAVPLTNHSDVALRGRSDFKRLNFAVLAAQGVQLCSLPLIALYGLKGAGARIAIVGATIIVSRLLLAGMEFKIRIQPADCMRLSRTGLPLLISGYLFSALMVIDRTVAAALLDAKSVGHLALAGMILQGVQAIPQSLSMVLFPMMAKEYGRNRRVRDLGRYLNRSLIYNLLCLIPVVIIIYSLVGPAVASAFPSYLPGVPSARLATLGCLLWVYLGTGSIFGITGNMKGYLLVLALSVLMAGLGSWIAIWLGYGIEGVTVARLLGTAITCIYTLGASHRMCYSTFRS